MLQKLKNFIEDYGRTSWMAGATALLPVVGSMFLLAGVYRIAPWLQENQGPGIMLFILVMTVFAGLALLATNILGIVSGFAFDFELGVFAQITGIAGASTLMFFMARLYARRSLLSAIDKKPKLRAIHMALVGRSFLRVMLLVALIRLSPAVPFALTNFMASAAGISFKAFFAGTLLGMLPRSSAIVFVGSSLSELDFSEPQETWMIFSGIAATIAAFAVVSIIAKRALDNLAAEE